MLKLNYFDLGSYKDGKEIDLFIKLCEENNFKYRIFAIEAHPEYCEELKIKHINNKNVFIINKAICNKEKKIKLYINYTYDGEGNSIFSTKNNVTDEYLWVHGTKFSSLLEKITPNYKNENNILRFNIEGAEWFLMKDMVEKDIFKYFKIILGVNPDITKVSEIEHKFSKYNKILKKNNISVERFSGGKTELNVDLLELINKNFVF